MAPPLPPPAPGVAVVQVRTPPSLQTPARRAHVAIYTGMGALELASVLQSVLELPAETMCTGFLVVDAHSSSHHHQHRHRQAKKNTLKKKTKRHSAFDTNDTYQRIVPLSLACLAPDLLTTVRRHALSPLFDTHCCAHSLVACSSAKRVRDCARCARPPTSSRVFASCAQGAARERQ